MGNSTLQANEKSIYKIYLIPYARPRQLAPVRPADGSAVLRGAGVLGGGGPAGGAPAGMVPLGVRLLLQGLPALQEAQEEEGGEEGR